MSVRKKFAGGQSVNKKSMRLNKAEQMPSICQDVARTRNGNKIVPPTPQITCKKTRKERKRSTLVFYFSLLFSFVFLENQQEKKWIYFYFFFKVDKKQ